MTSPSHSTRTVRNTTITRSIRESGIKKTSYDPRISEWDETGIENDPKYQQLKEMFDARIETVEESIKKAFELIQTDNLIDTLKQDATTSEYVYDRVKEIVETCIKNDREALIERVCQQYANLKSEYYKLEQENIKVRNLSLLRWLIIFRQQNNKKEE